MAGDEGVLLTGWGSGSRDSRRSVFRRDEECFEGGGGFAGMARVFLACGGLGVFLRARVLQTMQYMLHCYI
jgi:hypothetical protein